MKNVPILKLGKLDAARRQLETAVHLWFQDGDPVSIHTLLSAAYELLNDISSHRGNGPMLLTKEGMAGRIKPGREKEFFLKVSRAKNFFKHADKDPDEVIDFRPGSNEIFLWECCKKYKELSGEDLAKLAAMDLWFMLVHSELFTFPEGNAEEFAKCQQGLGSMEKLAFFREFMATRSEL